MDFKQPLESSVNLINKNGEPKTNDFSSKLNEVNKKENYSKEPKISENSKEIKDTKDLDIIEEESPKKDEKVLFQGMINLINIIPETKEDTEIEEIVLVESILDSEIIIEKSNLNTTEELYDNSLGEIVDESLILVNQDADNGTVKLSTLKEVKLREQVNPEELKVVQMPIEQKKLEKMEETEEPFISEEVNVVDNKDSTIKENLNEFENQGQSNNSKSEKEFELVETSLDENGSKIEDKTFVPIVKNGVKFSVDKPTELEVQLPIEPKEVVEQIVQKVKFDLSENKNEIKLSLKPEALGEMTMNIEVAKDGVIAKIMVDNHRAKEIIEGNIFQLKEGIKDTVLEIKTFEVFVGSGSDFNKHSSGQFNLKQNSKKMRIKNEDNKRVENYGEQLVDDRRSSINPYSESSLNLMA
jgi:flagellar hook-length control protein FliK